MLDVLWRSEAFRNPSLFLITLSWLLFHVLMLISVAKLLKAPFFFVAVGSMANIGGAVTAPIVASAFDPALAPVGVLLAVLGYALGTCKALPPPAPTSPTSATCFRVVLKMRLAADCAWLSGLLMCLSSGAETCAALEFSGQ